MPEIEDEDEDEDTDATDELSTALAQASQNAMTSTGGMAATGDSANRTHGGGQGSDDISGVPL